jgi:DNA-binding response OmpR family regulator
MHSAPASDRMNSARRILLVDDERHIQRINFEGLTRAGYQVDVADSGVSAWKALTTNSYDLMITDNTMPRVTGMDLIKHMRSEGITLPVILASGTAQQQELVRFPWMAVSALLPKPYTIGQLLKLVDSVLRTTHSDR